MIAPSIPPFPHPPDTAAAAWLAVDCAGAGLLVPLAGAGEIFSPEALLPVPHTKAWFLGVAHCRGSLYGVVDLAAFLGLRPPVGRDALHASARLLALNPRLGAHCAVLVDGLAGLRSRPQMQAGPDDPGFALGPDVAAGARWRDNQGRIWQEMDLAALAGHTRFLAIAAAAR
jgi:twitching motility protein PilI